MANRRSLLLYYVIHDTRANSSGPSPVVLRAPSQPKSWLALIVYPLLSSGLGDLTVGLGIAGRP